MEVGEAMNCKAYRNEIEDSDLGGRLSPPAQKHLEHCPACLAFKSERAALRGLVGSLGKVSAPADFDFRLRARIHTERNSEGRSVFRRLLTPAASTALASCFVLALMASILLRQPADAPQKAGVESAPQESSAAPQASTSGEDVSVSEERRVIQTEGKQVVTVSDNAPRATQKEPEKVAANTTKRARRDRENDFAVRNAKVVTREDFSEGEVAHLTTPVPVSVPAMNQTLKVVLRDERGASRVVSMRSVSFGSQPFVGGLKNSFVPANASREVVW